MKPSVPASKGKKGDSKGGKKGGYESKGYGGGGKGIFQGLRAVAGNGGIVDFSKLTGDH